MAKWQSGNVRLVWQFIRLATISSMVFMAALALLLAFSGWIYRDRVKDLFLSEVYSMVQADISVESMRLDLFRKFPMASLHLGNATVAESGREECGGDTLLHAGSIHLQFNLRDLLRGNYTIKSITLSDGTISLAVNEKGEPNHLLREQGPRGPEHSFAFAIERLRLRNIHGSFRHSKRDHIVAARFDDMRLSLEIKAGEHRIRANGSGMMQQLTLAGNGYPVAGPIALNTLITFSPDTETRVHQSNLTWNGHEVRADATIPHRMKGKETTVQITGQGMRAGNLLRDLPVQYRMIPAPLKPEGILDLDASFSLPGASKSPPAVNVAFWFREGSIAHPGTGERIAVNNLKGTYGNGANRSPESTFIRIDHVEATTGISRLEGNGTVRNARRPEIKMTLKAQLDAEEVHRWTNQGAISRPQGKLSMNLQFAGQMNADRRLTARELVNARMSGDLELSDVAFHLQGNHHLLYRGFHGTMRFDDERLVIEQLSGTAGQSSFQVSGVVDNALEYFLLPDETLVVRARLRSPAIALDELLRGAGTNEAKQTSYQLQFPDKLDLTLESEIDKLGFSRFSARQVAGLVRLKNQQLFADHLVFHAMEGLVHLHGTIDAAGGGDKIVLLCNAHLSEVNINQLFYQTGNFGQQNLLHDNIYGRVTADIQFLADWTPALEIDWGSMETTAKLKVTEGRLVDYHPLIALGKFLRTDDLHNVSFSTLENEIHISDRSVRIPEMEISSSALDLRLSGVHTFGNDIDYRIRVRLSDLLARSHRERRNPQEQYGEIIDDGLGVTLFLGLTGSAKDPVFRYDHQGARQKLRDDLRKERETLVSVLRDEFSFLRREPTDTVREKEERPAEESGPGNKQEEEGFVIEWDESEW